MKRAIHTPRCIVYFDLISKTVFRFTLTGALPIEDAAVLTLVSVGTRMNTRASGCGTPQERRRRDKTSLASAVQTRLSSCVPEEVTPAVPVPDYDSEVASASRYASRQRIPNQYGFSNYSYGLAEPPATTRWRYSLELKAANDHAS